MANVLGRDHEDHVFRARIERAFARLPDTGQPFKRSTVTGRSRPDVNPIRVRNGKRYRIALKNGTRTAIRLISIAICSRS